jgi:hypothetical protein
MAVTIHPALIRMLEPMRPFPSMIPALLSADFLRLALRAEFATNSIQSLMIS